MTRRAAHAGKSEHARACAHYGWQAARTMDGKQPSTAADTQREQGSRLLHAGRGGGPAGAPGHGRPQGRGGGGQLCWLALIQGREATERAASAGRGRWQGPGADGGLLFWGGLLAAGLPRGASARGHGGRWDARGTRAPTVVQSGQACRRAARARLRPRAPRGANARRRARRGAQASRSSGREGGGAFRPGQSAGWWAGRAAARPNKRAGAHEGPGPRCRCREAAEWQGAGWGGASRRAPTNAGGAGPLQRAGGAGLWF